MTSVAIWAIALPAIPDSAPAGTLPNSVKVGDRSKMNIRRMSRPGEKFIKMAPPPVEQRKAGRESATRNRPANHGWFWAHHGATRAAATPARWGDLLDSMRTRRESGSGIVSNRLMERVFRDHGPLIAGAASRHGVSAALIAAVIAIESAGRTTARSHKNAQGLMQLIPATARRFGVSDSFDAAANINGGTAYLDWLLKRFGEDVVLTLAGYNAGEGAVDKHGGVPPYRETRDYVVKVLDAIVAAERLCGATIASPRATCTVKTAAN